jgi:hypothetical protein
MTGSLNLSGRQYTLSGIGVLNIEQLKNKTPDGENVSLRQA